MTPREAIDKSDTNPRSHPARSLAYSLFQAGLIEQRHRVGMPDSPHAAVTLSQRDQVVAVCLNCGNTRLNHLPRRVHASVRDIDQLR